jgi:hypothetical protein
LVWVPRSRHRFLYGGSRLRDSHWWRQRRQLLWSNSGRAHEGRRSHHARRTPECSHRPNTIEQLRPESVLDAASSEGMGTHGSNRGPVGCPYLSAANSSSAWLDRAVRQRDSRELDAGDVTADSALLAGHGCLRDVRLYRMMRSQLAWLPCCRKSLAPSTPLGGRVGPERC